MLCPTYGGITTPLHTIQFMLDVEEINLLSHMFCWLEILLLSIEVMRWYVSVTTPFNSKYLFFWLRLWPTWVSLLLWLTCFGNMWINESVTSSMALFHIIVQLKMNIILEWRKLLINMKGMCSCLLHDVCRALSLIHAV